MNWSSPTIQRTRCSKPVRDTVAGVSSACANVFGATDAAARGDMPLLDDNPVPGTSGLPSLRKLIGTGHTVLTS